MRIRVHYAGHVQGVGFRATARHIASSHPVSGFVRNEPDGGVTLEAQGEPDVVRAYLEELRAAMARFIRAEAEGSLSDVPGERGFVVQR